MRCAASVNRKKYFYDVEPVMIGITMGDDAAVAQLPLIKPKIMPTIMLNSLSTFGYCTNIYVFVGVKHTILSL